MVKEVTHKVTYNAADRTARDTETSTDELGVLARLRPFHDATALTVYEKEHVTVHVTA